MEDGRVEGSASHAECRAVYDAAGPWAVETRVPKRSIEIEDLVVNDDFALPHVRVGGPIELRDSGSH